MPRVVPSQVVAFIDRIFPAVDDRRPLYFAKTPADFGINNIAAFVCITILL